MIKLNILSLCVFILCFPAIALTDEAVVNQDRSIELTSNSDASSEDLINRSVISLKMYKNVIPAFANGKIIFLGKDGVLYSVNDKNLTECYWKLDVTKGSKLYRASILYSDAMVLYIADDNVYGIDFDTGEIKWQKSLRSVISGTPIIVNGNLIVVTIDNFLYSFNIANGVLLWSMQESIPDVKSYDSFSATSHDNVVVVSFSNGKIVALNSLTGFKMWENNISSNVVNSIPFSNGVALRSTKESVVAVDKFHNISNIGIESGKILWSKDFKVQNISQIKDNCLVGIIDGKLTLLNIDTGEFLWQYDLLQHGKSKIQWSEPIVKDSNVLVIGSNGCIILVDYKSGALKLVNYVLSSSYYVPVFINSSVYVVTNQDKIIVFH